MLVSSTGIAQQHLVQRRLHRGDRLDDARRVGQRRRRSGGTASRPAGARPACGPSATVGVRLLELGQRVRRRARAAPPAPRRRARRCGGSPARRASPGGCAAVIRAAARADGVPRLERDDRAAAAAAGGLDQSGLAQGGHRLAQRRAGDAGAARRARARAAAWCRAGRRRAGSRWPAAPRTPRRRGARAPAAAPPRGGRWSADGGHARHPQARAGTCQLTVNGLSSYHFRAGVFTARTARV